MLICDEESFAKVSFYNLHDIDLLQWSLLLITTVLFFAAISEFQPGKKYMYSSRTSNTFPVSPINFACTVILPG